MNLALFDMDGTLLPIDSNHAFGLHMVKLGWTDGSEWLARNNAFINDHHQGVLNLDHFIDFATEVWRERPRREVLAARDAFIQQVVIPAIPPASRSLIAKHKDAGDLTAIVTGSNEFIAEPIAKEFGVDHLLAVRLERNASGVVTGRIDGIPSFHAGKIDRVHEWLSTLGRRLAEFDRVTFYGDSVNDIPLMDVVNDPVAVNPSDHLRHLAVMRGWPILTTFE